MKILTRIFLPMVFILAACSSSSVVSLELIESNAEIVTDEGISGATIITGGEKEGEEIVPTVLHYTFTIENTGASSIADNSQYDIKMEPSQKLTDVLKDTLGENVINPPEPSKGGGVILREIPAGEKGEWELDYTLGAKEENPEIPPLPDENKLEELENNALNATLILTENGEEIARFDLDSK